MRALRWRTPEKLTSGGKHYSRRELFPDVQGPAEPVEQSSEKQVEDNPKLGDQGEAELAKRSYARILRRMNDFNKDAECLVPKLGEQIKKSEGQVLPEEKAAQLPEMARLIRGHYAVADTLSLYFQSRWRRALIRIFLLALLAIISFEVYAHLLTEPWVLALYPVALGGALLVYLVATKNNYQSKYLDYRALAEGLRVQLFWRLAGLEDEVVDYYLRKQRTELDWIRNAIRARNVPVTQSAAQDYAGGRAYCEPDCLQAIKVLVRDHWLNDQRNFFSRNTGRDARKLKRHELMMKWLFRFGLALSIVVVFLHTWFHQRINDVGSDQKFQPEQQVVAQGLPEPLAVLFHIHAAHRQEFRPDKTGQATGDAEDDNRYAQHTDPEARMVKICHRAKCLGFRDNG